MAMGYESHHVDRGAQPAVFEARSSVNLNRRFAMSRYTPAMPRVCAADFPTNLDWIHTGDRSLSLSDLRGNVVLLDFWTYG